MMALPLLLRRVVAYALDCLLAFLVTIGGVQGGSWLATSGTWWEHLRSWPAVEGWIFASVTLPTGLYFSLAEASRWQATLGKRMLGLRAEDRRGRRLSVARALGRNGVKLIPWMFVHVGVLVPAAGGVVSLGAQPAAMGWWWGLLITADVLSLLYLLTPLGTGGARSIHDLVIGTAVRRRPRQPR